MPVSSPCAPAAGCSETASIPLTSASIRSSSHISASAPCASSSGDSGWTSAKPGSARRPLVDDRVVLHRARAERVEVRRDAEVPLRQPREVAHHLGSLTSGKPSIGPRTSSARSAGRSPRVGRSSPAAPPRGGPATRLSNSSGPSHIRRLLTARHSLARRSMSPRAVDVGHAQQQRVLELGVVAPERQHRRRCRGARGAPSARRRRCRAARTR